MGLFDFMKKEEVKIDYDSIGAIINGVVEKLNNYMIDNPEIVLNPEKKKSLLSNESLDNEAKEHLAAYYCAILEWYSSNKKASDGLVKYMDDNYPLIDKEKGKKMLEAIPDKSKKAEQSIMHITKIVMDMEIINHKNRMNNSLKSVSVPEMLGALGDVVLNEYFNQKCTPYNRTLISESLNAVLKTV